LDRGDLDACRKSLEQNALFLNTNADAYKSPALKELAESNLDQLNRLKGAATNAAPAARGARKGMRDYQNRSDSQQAAPSKR